MNGSILLGILELFLLFALGFLARRFKLIGDDVIGGMSRIIFDILFPVYIFGSIVKDFDPGRLNELWPLPCIGFGLMLLGGGASFVLGKGITTREEGIHPCRLCSYS